RPREEEREQEGDRAERLLATGEERETLHPLRGRTGLELYAGFLLVLLALREAQASLAAGEDGRRHVFEVAADGLERVGETPLDRLGQLVAELLELGQAVFESAPLGGELLEACLLRLVLLVGERVDLAQGLAPALE